MGSIQNTGTDARLVVRKLNLVKRAVCAIPMQRLEWDLRILRDGTRPLSGHCLRGVPGRRATGLKDVEQDPGLKPVPRPTRAT